jgi:PKD domain
MARRWMWCAALLSSVALMLATFQTAVAVVPSLDGDNGGDGPTYSGDLGDNGVGITGEDPGGSSGGDDGSDGTSDVGYVPTGPTYEYDKVPACMANGPGEDGNDALCGAATMSCDPGELRWMVYRRIEGGDGPWESLGTQCLGPGEDVVPPEPEVTEADVVDAAEAAAPDSEVHVEPATESYVNVPNNFYADSDAQTVTLEVLGEAIAVQFAPQRYAWDFGDGGTATGAGVEGAKVGSAGAVEHRYRRGGEYGITLTRTFTVSFTLPSGEAVTVPGDISSTSDPYPLSVGEVQSVVTDVE